MFTESLPSLAILPNYPSPLCGSLLPGLRAFVPLWFLSPIPTLTGLRSLANMTAQPIPSITLPPMRDSQQEGEWLRRALQNWLDREFLPELINVIIARRAAQIFVRQRLEGENDLGSLVIAIVTEMQAFDFRESFYSEFAVANAVSDLILDSLGIDRCCGQV